MMTYVLFVIGIALLIKGADFLVDGASALAQKTGISTLVIGLTVVAFGTSMPELVVNLFSAAGDATEIAFGNVVGSNMSNTLLILGLSAVIYPIRVQYSTIWREIPFSLLAVAALFVVANDFLIDGIELFSLTRGDGLVLLLFFSVFLYYVFVTARGSRAEPEGEHIDIRRRSNPAIFAMLFAGAFALYFGGNWTVDGAILIAEQFGISQFVISATIISVGTSLPELATSVMAAIKKDVDLAVGNIVGSNIFNIFWVLGVTAAITPIAIPSFINADLLVLIGATMLFFLSLFVGATHELRKREGILFVVLYAAYVIFLVARG